MRASRATFSFWVALTVSAGATGCEPGAPSSDTSAAPTHQTAARQPKMIAEELVQKLRRACPLEVEGSQVEVSDTEDGVTLKFTAPDGEVDELRSRVSHLLLSQHT